MFNLERPRSAEPSKQNKTRLHVRWPSLRKRRSYGEVGPIRPLSQVSSPSLEVPKPLSPGISPPLINPSQSGSSSDHPASLSNVTDASAAGPKVWQYEELWEEAYTALGARNHPLVSAYESLQQALFDNEGVMAEERQASDVAKRFCNSVLASVRLMKDRQWKKICGLDYKNFKRAFYKVALLVNDILSAGNAIPNLDPVNVGLPWAATCILLRLILNGFDESQSAINGVVQVAELITQYSALSKVNLERKDDDLTQQLRRKLVLLFSTILEFQAKAACRFGEHWVQRALRNTFKTDDWRVTLSNIMNLHKECMDVEVLLDFIDRKSTSVAMKSLLESNSELMKTLVENFNYNIARHESLLAWLSNNLVEGDHEDVRTKIGSRYWKTGGWFMEQLSSWSSIENKEPVLWVRGAVGMGKSTLLSHAIESYLKEAAKGVSEHLAFFYCSRNSGQAKVPGERSTRRGTTEILRSLLAQLAWTTDGFHSPDLFERLNSKVLPSAEECTELLQLIIKDLPRAIIAIDGLDECEDYDKLLYRLRAIQQGCDQINPTAPLKLKFVFASRMNVEVLAHFDKSDCAVVDVDSMSNLNDIEGYVQYEVKEPETRRLLDGKFPELEQRLIDVLSRKAQGMFRWVELQLETFYNPRSRLRTPNAVQRKLDNLEKEVGLPQLDVVYEELYVMNTGEDEDRECASVALKLAMCSGRTLRIEELVELVSSSQKADDTSYITQDYLLSICSNLIITNKEGLVQFAHESVREFLRKQRFTDTEANSTAAEICLMKLNALDEDTFATVSAVGSQPSSTTYALLFWGSHLEKLSESQRRQENLRCQLLKFMPEEGMSAAFTRYMVSIRPNPTNRLTSSLTEAIVSRCLNTFSMPVNPIFAACEWGLIEFVRKPPLPFNPNDANFRNSIPLAIASNRGHLEIVKLLLAAGATIQRSVVDACVMQQRLDILRLLLVHGAQTNIEDLRWAISINSPEFLKLIWSNLSSKEVADKYGESPLFWAAEKGLVDIVKALFELGGDAKLVDWSGRTALHRAAFEGHIDAARLLVENGANVDAADLAGRTPLDRAAVAGKPDLVSLLLAAGASSKILDNYGRTALHHAVQSRNLEVVGLLLKAGAPLDVRDEKGRSVLDIAEQLQREHWDRSEDILGAIEEHIREVEK